MEEEQNPGVDSLSHTPPTLSLLSNLEKWPVTSGSNRLATVLGAQTPPWLFLCSHFCLSIPALGSQ